MAKPRKLKNGWFIEVQAGGLRRSKMHKTRRAAELWAAQAKAELSALGEGTSLTHTLGDVFARYAEEVSTIKRGERWEAIRLAKLQSAPIASIKLMNLKREHFEKWLADRLRSVKASSVNRELNLISHCLTQARRWRLMNHNPLDDLQRPKNPPHRERRVTHDEIERLCVALDYAPELPIEFKRQQVAVAFLFAIETAMRAGEICGLMRENVNLKTRVAFLPTTKNGLPRYVPMTKRAAELLDSLPRHDHGRCFDLTSATLSTLFRKACKLAGVDGLTFHDTRHEAITRLAKRLDVLALARAVGHRDIKQLQTYYNESAEDLAKLL